MLVFSEALGEGELERALVDSMIALEQTKPKEFQALYSGIAGISRLLYAMSQHLAKQPTQAMRCMKERFTLLETLRDAEDLVQDRQRYYKDAPQNLVELVEGAANNEMDILFGELADGEKFKAKDAKIQAEYKPFERAVRDRAFANTAAQFWLKGRFAKAFVPMLYVFNVLLDTSQFMLSPRHKDQDGGLWSPSHLDIFLGYASQNRPKGAKFTYLEGIVENCEKLQGFPVAREGIGAFIGAVEAARSFLDPCERKVKALSKDWLAMREDANRLLTSLQELQDVVVEAAGKSVLRIVQGDDGSEQDAKEKLKRKAQEYALEVLKTEEGSEKKLCPLQGLAEDVIVRKGLSEFCGLVGQRPKEKLEQIFTASNVPSLS